MLDKIVKRLAGEGVDGIVFKEKIITINHRRTGARVTAGIIKAVKSFLWLRGRKNARVFGAELASGIECRVVGITVQIALFEDVVPERKAVLDAEGISPIVAGASELRRPRERLHQAEVGLYSEVEAFEVDDVVELRRGNFCAFGVTREVTSVCSVDPVVESPAQAVDAKLLVPLLKSGEENGANVGLAVTGGIFGVNDVGSSREQDALPPTHDSGGEVEAIEEEGGLIVFAIAIEVFEKANAPAWFAVDAGGIVGHFCDPEFAVCPPINSDRILHQGFGRDEFDRVTLRNVDCFQGFGGRAGTGGDLGLLVVRACDASSVIVSFGIVPGHGLGEKSDFIEASFKGKGAAEAIVGGLGWRDFSVNFGSGISIEEERETCAIVREEDVMPGVELELCGALKLLISVLHDQG